MLRHLLDPARWEVNIASPHLLVSELAALVEYEKPAVVCIGALPSGGLASHTRHLCKRLRTRFPGLRIVVGRWGLEGGADDAGGLVLAAGADLVGTTLGETRDQIQNVSRLAARAPTDDAPSAAPADSGAGDLSVGLDRPGQAVGRAAFPPLKASSRTD